MISSHGYDPTVQLPWSRSLSKNDIAENIMTELHKVPGLTDLHVQQPLDYPINDKLPNTPSRKVPPQFIGRVLSGCLVGATFGAAAGSLTAGLLAGALGAVVGTLGGAATRRRLATAFGKDLPVALLEDVAAIVISIVAVSRF